MACRGRTLLAAFGLLGLAVLLSENATGQQPTALPSQTPGSLIPPTVGPGPGQPQAPTLPDPAPPIPGPRPPEPPTQPQPVQPPIAPNPPDVQRLTFRILPNTPTKNLLPTPPTVKPITGPVLTDDIAKIPEAEFQARAEKIGGEEKQRKQTAHQLAKINHLNAKKTDAFMTTLLEHRADLVGLPFVMGDDCRTSGERTKQFTNAVNTVRQALSGSVNVNALQGIQFGGGGRQSVVTVTEQLATITMSPFWTQYNALCEQEDAANPRPDKALKEHITLARMAALTQMLAPEPADVRLGLVKYLTGVPHVESTKALARMAIFSAEDDIRTAAIAALKVRREQDYNEVLVKGLRYPWPAVAKRSADAIARLGRTELVPELLAVLEESDPRMPAVKEMAGKKVSVVREMVKINHHRNCMMCHAPGNPETGSGNALVAEVPIPGQPLPSPSQGYGQSFPEMMIRIDVTYLRQDFSAMLPVKDAHPWPEEQRFDFLVRERQLTDEEAVSYRDQLTPKEVGVLSPYHKASLNALRELTGKDTTPTAEAWRKMLNMPAKPSGKRE